MTRLRIWLVLAFVVLLAHQVLYFDQLGRDAIDDAYISFRYAQNLVRGEGLVFNPGERVEGYTNFLWTILLAPIIALGLEPGPIAMALGGALALATLTLLYRARPLFDPGGGAIVGLALLTLAVDGSFAIWSVSGMETALFAFLVTAGTMSYLDESARGGRTAPLTGALFALASLARPEGILLFGVVVIHSLAYRLWSERRGPTLDDGLRLGIFALLYVPYFVWRYNYYGYFFPNTFYLKVATEGNEPQIQRGWTHLGTFLDAHLGWLLPALGAISLWGDRRRFVTTCLGAQVIALVVYIVYIGGDWSVGRFFAPILPLAYLMVGMGAVDIYEAIRVVLANRFPAASTAWRVASLVAVFVGGAALLDSSSWRGEVELFVKRFQAREATQARVALGRWLAQQVPAETFIAVDAAGQIPYFSRLRALDIYGLTDEEVAHRPVEELGKGVPGHERFDLGYVVGRRPDLFIVWGDPGWIPQGYQKADWPWTEDPCLRGLLTIFRRQDWNGFRVETTEYAY